MKSKGLLKSNAVHGVIFILLPLLISIMMYGRMITVQQNYMEYQVTVQAETLGDLASQKLFAKLDELERIAGYYRDGKVDEATMASSFERLLKSSGHTSCGILKLGGVALYGEDLPPSEYPAVRKAFWGYSTIRYNEGKGLLFTVPVYNGNNIKYVLYEFCDADELFKGFGSDYYDGKVLFLLADGKQQKVISVDEDLQGDSTWLPGDTVLETTDKLKQKLNTNTSAATFYTMGSNKEVLLISEIGQGNLYLLGRVPYDLVAGGIASLSNMTLLVFCLLLILLCIGTFNMFSVSAKARESDALREAKLVAEEANRSKSKFLANMSHELRTPINVILGMDEMILREDTGETTRERAMDIKSAAQILLGLINDVLDFSKIEAGNLKIIPVKYNLIDMICDLVLLSENRARQKSLNFNMEIQPDLPVGLFGDDIHIRQVMINLLTNAVKYTEEGTVTLKITSEKRNDNSIVLRCAVQDTGIGIKEEDMKKLFIPFSRVEERRNRNVEGTGLGLSIIINLLKLMGSRLEVESVYGKGSVFYFDLEQDVVDPEPIGDIYERMKNIAKDYKYRVSFVAPKAKILMVDDNSMNRKLFTSLLKKTRLQITTVSSGKKALELVQQEHFDLIFMDYLMPGMDGEETLGRMRELGDIPCKDTPVIALTANAFNGSRELYMDMGFDDFLSKPIVAEKLEALIRDFLPQEYIDKAPVEESAEEMAEAGSAEEKKGATGKKEGSVGGDGAESLPEIDGVNWEYARLFMKDKNILLHSMQDFYGSIDEDYQELSALVSEIEAGGDITPYRICVHSLKSNAALVGILSVSELARLLEQAAWDGDRERIYAVTPLLLEAMQKMKERLRPYMEETAEDIGETKEKPSADASTLLSFFGMLRFSMEQMDIGGTDLCMKQIRAHSYTPELQEIVDRVGGKVAELDYDGAREEIERAEKAFFG